MFQRCFQPIVPAIIVLPALLCLTTSKQLFWKGPVIFWWYKDTEKLTYASRGQESQKKDKTIKGQHVNYSIKCLATSFALKQAPFIQVSLLTEKQNFALASPVLDRSSKILLTTAYPVALFQLEMCGSWSEAFDTWNLLVFFMWVYETTITRFNS